MHNHQKLANSKKVILPEKVLEEMNVGRAKEIADSMEMIKLHMKGLRIIQHVDEIQDGADLCEVRSGK